MTPTATIYFLALGALTLIACAGWIWNAAELARLTPRRGKDGRFVRKGRR